MNLAKWVLTRLFQTSIVPISIYAHVWPSLICTWFRNIPMLCWEHIIYGWEQTHLFRESRGMRQIKILQKK